MRTKTVLKSLGLALIWCVAVAVGLIVTLCSAVVAAAQNVPRI